MIGKETNEQTIWNGKWNILKKKIFIHSYAIRFEQVNEPSSWISPVVPVMKNDDVRICLDMRRANEAVLRENHPLPTMEDFLPHLGKAKFFTKLDIKNAFHQVRNA